jgi:PKD repeat protein
MAIAIGYDESGREMRGRIVGVSSPNANFTAAIGPDPCGIAFINQTNGTALLTYLWDFGDGGTSTEKDPVHQYTAVGKYTVKLTATNAYGTNWREKIGCIEITE